MERSSIITTQNFQTFHRFILVQHSKNLHKLVSKELLDAE
jgi:hypothetical protein